MGASLPMYDWPELREATDAWWAALAEAFRAEGLTGVPTHLTRGPAPDDLWAAPDLFVSQTCGYPLMHAWAGRLTPVATPHYAAEGCDGPDYCSLVLVRADDAAEDLAALRGKCAAYNGEDSQSGYSAFRAAVAPHARDGRFFATTVRSGAHLDSMALVASGEADVCAVDSIVWALARHHRGELARRLRVLARTPAAPGLPLVTASARPDEEVGRMRAALRTAIAAPGLGAVREALLLRDMSELETGAYDRILQLERFAIDAGYPVLN